VSKDRTGQTRQFVSKDRTLSSKESLRVRVLRCEAADQLGETESIPTEANNTRVDPFRVIQGDCELPVNVLLGFGGDEGGASRALPAFLEPLANTNVAMVMTAPISRTSVIDTARYTVGSKTHETGWDLICLQRLHSC
jgi:hypothetical protein